MRARECSKDKRGEARIGSFGDLVRKDVHEPPSWEERKEENRPEEPEADPLLLQVRPVPEWNGVQKRPEKTVRLTGRKISPARRPGGKRPFEGSWPGRGLPGDVPPEATGRSLESRQSSGPRRRPLPGLRRSGGEKGSPSGGASEHPPDAPPRAFLAALLATFLTSFLPALLAAQGMSLAFQPVEQ